MYPHPNTPTLFPFRVYRVLTTLAWHPATTLSPLGYLLLGFALCVCLRLCRGAGRSPLPRHPTMRGLRFACGSASAEAPGVRPIQEVPGGRGSVRGWVWHHLAPSQQWLAASRRQEPPAATRSHQGLPGPAARAQPGRQPGAARSCQGPPGTARSHQEQPEARSAASQESPGAASSRQEQPGCARSGQEQPEGPICSIHRTVVCFGRWRSWSHQAIDP